MDYSKRQKSEAIGHIYGSTALPCLNSNISTETTDQITPGGTKERGLPALCRLSTQHRKSAFVLKESVSQLAEKYGLECLGFLTLTFSQHITCPKQAQKRLNSLISHVIKPRYRDYVGVMERQKSGRIHYHLLIALEDDIRTGVDFSEFTQGKYISANATLRKEWAYWRKTAPLYRFGRTELLPIRSTTEAIAKYVGKYIAKHIETRKPEDKGARLVRYSKGARAGTTRFQFQSDGSREWRRKVAIFAQIVQAQHPETPITELSDLAKILGKRWAYHHRDYILNLP